MPGSKGEEFESAVESEAKDEEEEDVRKASKKRRRKKKKHRKKKNSSGETSDETSRGLPHTMAEFSSNLPEFSNAPRHQWVAAEEEYVELNPDYPDLNPRKMNLMGPGKPPWSHKPPNYMGNNIVDAFRPLRIFMTILLRFPFGVRTNRHGLKHFVFGLNFAAFGFLFTLLIFTLIAVLMIGNALSLVHDNPPMPRDEFRNETFQDLRSSEMFIVHRNYLSLGIVVANLAQILISDYYLLFYRNGITQHLNKVAERLNLDMGIGLNHRARLWIYTWFAILFIFCGVWAIQFAPLITGGPAAMVVLTGRLFFQPIVILEEFPYIRSVLIFIFLYIFVSAKLYVFTYFFLCNLFENAQEQFNARLIFGLHGVGQFYSDQDKEKYRISLELLYDDLNTLVNLFGSVNDTYGLPIDVLLVCQTVTSILELYFMGRVFSATEEFRYARIFDGYVALMIFFHDITIFYLILRVAESVENYGQIGYEIVSSKGLIGHRTTKEILFMAGFFLGFSMDDSEIHFTGSEMLNYDDDFIISTFIDIVSHFLLLFTFNFRFTLTGELEGSADDAKVIRELEHTRQIASNYPIGF